MKLSKIAFLKPTVDTEVTPQPIRVATLPETFVPSPPRDPAAGPTQPFGDSRQSGRLDAQLGDPRAVVWIPRYATPLRPDTRAHSVLAYGDAVVVQAAVWQLFGAADGRLRGAGRTGTSPVAISPTDGTLRWVDLEGRLTAATLDRGEPIWTHGLFHGDGATYPFLAVRGDHAVVLGADRFVDPEAPFHPPPTLAVEALTITRPLSIAAGGILESVTGPGALTTARGESDIFGAADDDVVVVAWRDHVMTLDFDLTPHRVLTGTFEPRAVSVGDGRVYLIVRTAAGPRLWMLNAQGEQVFSATLPDEATETLVPPIVAPDHRVFVVTSKRIVAFSPIGDRLWEFAPTQGRPYAAVSADGWLLVAVDQSVGVLDVDGHGHSLFAVPGEVLRTPPVLTPEGDILVASERSLLCYRYEAAIEMGESTIVR